MEVKEIIARAKELANAQGRLPNSPADWTEQGDLHLCSGACIAYAAIEATGDFNYLSEFKKLVFYSDKNKFIPAVFTRYGLDGEVAKCVIAENDSMQESDRLEWFNKLKFSEMRK